MEKILDSVNQALHNAGVPKQTRIQVLKDVISGRPISLSIPESVLIELNNVVEFLNQCKDTDGIQQMFMKLGEKVLKQSLDQYYSPFSIGKFISDILENDVSVLEPACGTGDMIIRITANDYEFRDISSEACELLDLNLRLHGFTNKQITIRNLNSLSYDSDKRFDIVVTNPPFGTKTIETDSEILKKYVLSKGKKKEQLGKLFIEHSLKQLKKDGLLFIIVPSGYLSNATDKHLRKMLLDEYKIIGVFDLPTNTFKRSGTGVETSLLVIQNTKVEKGEDYEVFINKLEKIGIDTKKKNTPLLYKVDDNGVASNVIDNDFDALREKVMYFAFKNNIKYLKKTNIETTYQSVTRCILEENNMSLDIKRYTEDYLRVVAKIRNQPYFHLKDFTQRNIEKVKVNSTQEYTYIDISEIQGYHYNTENKIKGGNLPGRATYGVVEDDIILSKLGGKPSFAIICDDFDTLIVTNGVFVLRISDKIKRLSLFKFLFSKDFLTQFNSLAGGSIMADVKEEDLLSNLFVPLLSDEELIQVEMLLTQLKSVHSLLISMKT
jgi:type I restriction enzyme M protein